MVFLSEKTGNIWEYWGGILNGRFTMSWLTICFVCNMSTKVEQHLNKYQAMSYFPQQTKRREGLRESLLRYILDMGTLLFLCRKKPHLDQNANKRVNNTFRHNNVSCMFKKFAYFRCYTGTYLVFKEGEFRFSRSLR